MKATTITEFVKFKLLETTTDEQLLSMVNNLNRFQQNQDGFMDAELLKGGTEHTWCIIYHYETYEKVQAIGKKLRVSKEFDEFISHVLPGSLDITFYNQASIW